jgi:hypothetical protein
MGPYRLYITLLCCCLVTGTQACHNARSPQGAAAASARTDTPAAAGISAAPSTAAPASVPSSGGATVQPPAAGQTPASAPTSAGTTSQSSAAAQTTTAAPSSAGATAPVSATGRQLAAAALAVKQSSTDPEEQAFRRFFAVFQKAVQQDNPGQLATLLYFPLQTAQQWTNEDLKNMDVDKESGKVSRNEFSSYHKNIFTPDVIRLLPKAKEEELSEIDAQSPEDYYKVLRRCTDKATKMYEVYMQYPEKNGTAESYFAFVFGRVNGQYKVIGYYAKWPAKG